MHSGEVKRNGPIDPSVKAILEKIEAGDLHAFKLLAQDGRPLLDLLTTKGGLTEDAALETTARCLGYPYSAVLHPELASVDASKTPINYLKKNLLVPISLRGDTLTVATCDPFNREAVDDLRGIYQVRHIETLLAPRREVVRVLNQFYEQAQHSSEQFREELDEESSGSTLIEELSVVEDLMDSTSEAPAIRLVNYLLSQAVKSRASDIHIEPYQDDLRIRFRIDGILYDFFSPPKRLHPSIVSRLKVMSDLNIAEKRLPQDGRIQIKIGGREVDIRVSVIPTFYGERIVLRLLDKRGGFLTLEELGLEERRRTLLKHLIETPYGIILLTGPTGSGKTTSLYAMLSSINTSERNIITVEDPIEYQLHGVGQIQVAPKVGLTFASGLRSILRHDPDVIMVGEIRDRETVEIAIQASLTGHMVLSTLHTNDAVSSVTRLIDMGVEPFLITSSLIAVIAQRLARCVCPHCGEEYDPPHEVLERMGIDRKKIEGARFRKGRGCSECFQTGYRGRMGIFEVLPIDDEIRRTILAGADSVEITALARSKGFMTLREDGIHRAMKGLITLEEIIRVT